MTWPKELPAAPARWEHPRPPLKEDPPSRLRTSHKDLYAFYFRKLGFGLGQAIEINTYTHGPSRLQVVSVKWLSGNVSGPTADGSHRATKNPYSLNWKVPGGVLRDERSRPRRHRRQALRQGDKDPAHRAVDRQGGPESPGGKAGAAARQSQAIGPRTLPVEYPYGGPWVARGGIRTLSREHAIFVTLVRSRRLCPTAPSTGYDVNSLRDLVRFTCSQDSVMP